MGFESRQPVCLQTFNFLQMQQIKLRNVDLGCPCQKIAIKYRFIAKMPSTVSMPRCQAQIQCQDAMYSFVKRIDTSRTTYLISGSGEFAIDCSFPCSDHYRGNKCLSMLYMDRSGPSSDSSASYGSRLAR